MSTDVAYHRIKELFLEAIDLEPAARDEFVDEVCAGDSQLATEVRNLIDFSQTATLSLQPAVSPAPEVAPEALRDSSASTGDPTATDELLASLEGWQRFTALEPIGRGGMGIVFKAWDPRLKRPVALKFLNHDSPGTTARLRREAELQARIEHENVLDVYETGEVNDQPFIAMKYVDGPSLMGMRSGTTLSERIEIMSKVAAAIHAAHQLDLIHRDVKPGNLLVERTPDGFKPFVSDFGIASELGGPALSRTSAFLGSPRYMAPEQLDGQGAKLDHRTDIYGLGATFYEFLSGRPPFPDKSIVDLLIKIRAAPPRALEETARDVPPELAAIVMRCLEKTPEARYPSAEALAEDLRRLLMVLPEGGKRNMRPEGGKRNMRPEGGKRNMRPEGGTEDNPPQRRPRNIPPTDDSRNIVAATDRPRRSTYGPSLTAAVILLVAALGAAASWYSQRSSGATAAVSEQVSALPALNAETLVEPRRTIAVVDFLNLSGRRESEWLSTALCEMLTSELEQGRMLRLVPGENVARISQDVSLAGVRPLAAERLHELRRSLGADLLVRGSYLSFGPEQGGKVRLDLRVEDISGEGVDAPPLATFTEDGTEADLLQLVLSTGARLRGALGAETSPAGSDVAVSATFPSDLEAARLYSEGLSRLRRFDALSARDLFQQALESSPEHPLLHFALSRAWLELGHDTEAEQSARRAFESSGELTETDRLEIEAHFRSIQHDWPRAIEIFQQLLSERPDEIEYGLRLASIQIFAGQVPDAYDTLAQLRQLPALAGADPRIDLTEAQAASAVSDWQAAIEMAQRAREQAAKNGSPHVVARARLIEAWALRNLSELESARLAADESKAIYAAVGNRHRVAAALSTSAAVLKQQGKYDLAIERYREALAIAQDIGNLYLTSVVNNNMAGALRELGKMDVARRHYQGALAIHRQMNDAASIALVESNIGLIDMLQGRHDLALEHYKSSLAGYRQVGHRRGIAAQLGRMASALTIRGELDEATHKAEESLEIFREIGMKSAAASELNVLGAIHGLRGDIARAGDLFREALEVYRAIGNRRGVTESLLGLGKVELMRGQLEDATQNYQQALADSRELGLKMPAADAQRGLANVFLHRGELDSAGKNLEDASAAYRELGHGVRLGEVQIDLARLEAERGRLTLAAKAAREAARRFRELELPESQAEAEMINALLSLSDGQIDAAGTIIEQAKAPIWQAQRPPLQMAAEIAEARIRAVPGASYPARESARETLIDVANRASEAGLTLIAFDARLATGELEILLGEPEQARLNLATLVEEARADGLNLIVRRAAELLQDLDEL